MENVKRLTDWMDIGEYKEFIFTFSEGGEILQKEFNEYLEIDGFEWQYALCDIANEIHCLKPGETIFCCSDRGNQHSKGFVLRIK